MLGTDDWNRAIAHLRRHDPALERIIDRVGPHLDARRLGQTPFTALLRAINYQQISRKAAASIHHQLLGLFPNRRPSARALLALDDAQLRTAGLSRSKILAVRDLAAKVVARRVPSRRALDGMTDAEIIERLTEIRGIGQWTVEMMLIFVLNRLDILPINDLGIRRGFMISRDSDVLPQPAELLAHGEIWRPYRSVASRYLWRACDL